MTRVEGFFLLHTYLTMNELIQLLIWKGLMNKWCSANKNGQIYQGGCWLNTIVTTTEASFTHNALIFREFHTSGQTDFNGMKELAAF